MTKTRVSANKKPKPTGRPKTGIGKLIGLRWHPPVLAAIDDWRREQPDLPSQAQAIRRLVEIGLAAKGKR
jgi:hypothetical protein